MQADPINPKLKLPGTKRLKLKCDEPLSSFSSIKPTLNRPGSKRLKLRCDEVLSSFAFKFSLRRYTKEAGKAFDDKKFGEKTRLYDGAEALEAGANTRSLFSST